LPSITDIYNCLMKGVSDCLTLLSVPLDWLVDQYTGLRTSRWYKYKSRWCVMKIISVALIIVVVVVCVLDVHYVCNYVLMFFVVYLFLILIISL
jgi:hypothetical protein